MPLSLQRGLPKIVIGLFTAALVVPTIFAAQQHGIVGIFDYQLASWAGLQVLIDLVVALSLVWLLLWEDAKALGRRPWLWLALTFAIGSFSPLLYLLTRKAPSA